MPWNFPSPIVNKQQNFHEVTKFVAGPGMHQPTCTFELGFNKDKYNALPPEYKAMIQEAAKAMAIGNVDEGYRNGYRHIEILQKQRFEVNPR